MPGTEVGARHPEMGVVARGARTAALGGAAALCLGYVGNLLMGRFLGPAGYGTLVLGLGLFELALVLARAGLSGSLIRFVSSCRARGEMDKALAFARAGLRIASITGVGGMVVLFASSSPLALRLFRNPSLQSVLVLFSAGIPLGALLAARLSSFQGAGLVALRVKIEKVGMPLARLLFLFLALGLGLRIRGAAAAIVASYGFALLYASFFSGGGRCMTVPRAFPGLAKELLLFSWPLLLTGVLTLMIDWTDVLMLGFLRPSSDVGVYRAASRTAFLVAFPLVALNVAIPPMIARFFSQGRMGGLEEMFKVMTKWVFAFSLPIYILLVLFGRDVLLLFGRDFQTGFSCLLLLGFAQLVNAAVGPSGYMLVMTGRPRIEFANSVILCASNVVLNAVLIPRYGIGGAATASMLAIGGINVLRLAEVMVVLRVHPYSLRYAGPLAASLPAFLASFAVVRFWSGQPVVRALLGIAVYGICYFAVLFLAQRRSGEDRIVLNALFGGASGPGRNGERGGNAGGPPAGFS